jgi:3-dehydroquinate dehydratase/shikimate dehydrogenase
MKDSATARICIPLCDSTLPGMLAAVASVTDAADLIELRLDCLDPQRLDSLAAQLEEFLRGSSRPVILTYRPQQQGGYRQLGNKARLLFWLFNRPATADFYDIEFDLVRNQGLFQFANKLDWSRVICSHHDFSGSPANLAGIYQQLAATPAHVVKIAVQAHDVTDCLPIFELLERAQQEGRELIAIAMGTAGVATRILGPSRGSFLTYGSLGLNRGTAPGQVTAEELREVYHVDQINRQTQITGLVGLPTTHSLSPQIQNAAFRAAEIDAVYLPFEVRDLPAFISRMVRPRSRELDWNLRGFSVTAPYKLSVMDELDWIEPAAQQIGAVNTVVIEGDELHGYNTDAEGFLAPLLERVGPLRGLRCAVLGSGGAARTAAWTLRREGAAVTIIARQLDKALALAAAFALEARQLDNTSLGDFDVVVNTTPLGTSGPLQDQTAVTSEQLRGARLAYDLVYNPAETLFMREARAAGCEILGGLPMLVTQAAAQFRLWTRVEPPKDIMLHAAESALNRL